MPQRILGIDIGTYSVKVAEVVRRFRTFDFVGFYERRIQYNELLTHEESIAIALQGLIDDHHLQWDIAVAGFPGQRVSSRLLTFPFTGAKKIDQTVRFEIESFIPFDVNDVVIDYAVVASTKESSKVLVVYVQKGEVVKRLTMLEGAGVDPRHLCVEGVEAITLVNLGMVPPEGGYAILDIGHEKTTLSICHGHRLGYVRSISIAGRDITERVATRLGIPIDEAERLKIEIGHLPSEAAGEMDDLTRGVVQAIASVMEELVLHLRQTLFSYRDEQGVTVEGIYLSGGTSRLPGLDHYLSDTLKQNVAYVNPLDFHFTKLDLASAHRHVIAQALAFALKGVSSGSSPDIDLRQGEIAFKGDVEQLGGSMRSAAISVLVVIGLGLSYFTVSYYSLKTKLKKIESDIREMVVQAIPDTPARAVSSSRGALAVVKSKRSEIAERREKLRMLLERSPLDVLKEISSILPPRAEVTMNTEKISILADRVVLSGSTTSFESVDKIRQSLEKSKVFKSVTSGNVRKGSKGDVKFDLSLDLLKGGDHGA